MDSDFIGISNSKPIGVIPSISTLGSSGSQGRLNSQQMVGEMGNAPSRQAAIGSQGVFPPKNTGSNVLALPHVSQWGVSHVTTWLSQYLHLPQYIGVFTENEVTGSVVLELNLDDFDYMNITALGHRKTLLKAVEELRRTGHMSAPLPLPLPPSATPIAANNAQATHSGPMYAPRTLDPAVRAAQEREAAEAQKESDKKLVHWSALQPLQQQQEGRGIVGDESMLANSGDIDEEEVSKQIAIFIDLFYAMHSINSPLHMIGYTLGLIKRASIDRFNAFSIDNYSLDFAISVQSYSVRLFGF